KSARTASRTPYKMDGVTDVYDDEPPYILDGPGNNSAKIRHDDVTPVGGTAAVPAAQTPQPAAASTSDEAHDDAPPKRRGLIVVILLLLLLILGLLAGWFWLQSQEDSVGAQNAAEEATEQTEAPVDRSDFIYARNRALGVVAQARGSAESAAFVASSDVRNRNHAGANRRRNRGGNNAGNANAQRGGAP